MKRKKKKKKKNLYLVLLLVRKSQMQFPQAPYEGFVFQSN